MSESMESKSQLENDVIYEINRLYPTDNAIRLAIRNASWYYVGTQILEVLAAEVVDNLRNNKNKQFFDVYRRTYQYYALKQMSILLDDYVCGVSIFRTTFLFGEMPHEYR